MFVFLNLVLSFELQAWNPRNSARHPSKMELWTVRIQQIYETSCKKCKLQMLKRSNSVRLPTKNEMLARQLMPPYICVLRSFQPICPKHSARKEAEKKQKLKQKQKGKCLSLFFLFLFLWYELCFFLCFFGGMTCVFFWCFFSGMNSVFFVVWIVFFWCFFLVWLVFFLWYALVFFVFSGMNCVFFCACFSGMTCVFFLCFWFFCGMICGCWQ